MCFVNKILFKHSHAHLFTYFLWLFSCFCGSVDCMLQRPYGLQSLQYLLPGPLQKMLFNLWSGELHLLMKEIETMAKELQREHGTFTRWRDLRVTGKAVFKYLKDWCLDEKLDPCLLNFIRLWDSALERFSQTQAAVLKHFSKALA